MDPANWVQILDNDHFLSLWYYSTWDWTQVSQAIGKHTNHYANGYSLTSWHKIILVRLTCHKNKSIIMTIAFSRCPWHNGYRHRKWTRRHKFKSWMRLIAFHIALIPLGKVWIQLFSLQLWVNSRTDWVL